MAKEYITAYETQSEYDAVKDTLPTPHVALVEETMDVYYKSYDYSDRYLTFVALENGTFKFNGNPINYSIDGGETWVELASDTNTPTVSAGNKIMWKAALTPTSSIGVGRFSSSGRFDVEGNVMSLLYGDEFDGERSLEGKNYAFYRLFSGCTNVVSAERMALPATTLAANCYGYMFNGCTSLTTAPSSIGDFSTTIASNSCVFMFSGCTSLTAAPELPATTLANNCYYYMFSNCTSLTEAPELPAEALASSCYYQMFSNCTSLTEAPELPATELVSGCYSYMFSGCTSLTTAPELPATTLVSNCYYRMFYDCTTLNYIKAAFTTTPSSTFTSNWVNGVASSGTFVMNANAEWNAKTTACGVNTYPCGWTVETYTPSS